MEENKLFHDRYFLERLLGRGNFAEVWLAKDTKTNIQVALKIYAPATGLDDAGLDVFAREFSLVVNANHKNLLKPLYYDSCDRKPYLVLPFCKAGSIMKKIGTLTEQEAWKLLRDVSSGLAWLHGMNPPVIHQDIKPDNIMIGENGEYMITDFGVSTHLKSTLRKSMSNAFSSAGTIAYMAPERFGKDNTPIMANDIYSLGSTVYEMLTGDTPFGNDGGLVQKKGAEIPELKGPFSEQLKKVVSKCLRANSWERPTAEQLEMYADCGVEGTTIHFFDEKPFYKKYWWVLLIIVVVLVGCVAFGISAYQKEQQEEKARITLVQKQNDSIKEQVLECLKDIDVLMKAGDEHDELYEKQYINAYKKLMDAFARSKDLQDGKEDVMIELNKRLALLEQKLDDAYKSLMEKREMFIDDKDVADEFANRANEIKLLRDTNKKETTN